MCHSVDFLLFILFWDSLRFLNLYVYVFCHIWGVFNHYFFEYYFSPIFFFSLSGTPVIHMLVLFWLSHRFEGLFILFFHIFSLFFSLNKFYWSFLKFIESVFCHSHSTIEYKMLLLHFSIFKLVSFNSSNFQWKLFYLHLVNFYKFCFSAVLFFF